MSVAHANVTGRKCSTIEQFCVEHGISRAFFYKLREQGAAPHVIRVGKRVIISDEAAAKWRRKMEVTA